MIADAGRRFDSVWHHPRQLVAEVWLWKFVYKSVRREVVLYCRREVTAVVLLGGVVALLQGEERWQALVTFVQWCWYVSLYWIVWLLIKYSYAAPQAMYLALHRRVIAQAARRVILEPPDPVSGIRLQWRHHDAQYLMFINDDPDPEAFKLELFITDVLEWSGPHGGGVEKWARLPPFQSGFQRRSLEGTDSGLFYTTEDVPFLFVTSADEYKTIDLAGYQLRKAGRWKAAVIVELNGTQVFTEDFAFEWTPKKRPVTLP